MYFEGRELECFDLHQRNISVKTKQNKKFEICKNLKLKNVN